MSTEIKTPLLYWNKFPLGIMPLGDRRIYIQGEFNSLDDPVSIEAQGLNTSNQVYSFNGRLPLLGMISADADITQVHSGTYQRMVKSIDHDYTIATALSEFDPETIKAHETFSVIEQAKALYYRALESVGAFGPGVVGVGFCMNMKVLPVLGGIPRANQLEDTLLEHTIKVKRGEDSISFFQIKDALIWSKGDKHANAMLSGGGRYAVFEVLANESRRVVSSQSLDLDRVVPIINHHIANGLELSSCMSPIYFQQFQSVLGQVFTTLCQRYHIPIGSTDQTVKLHLLDV